MRPLLALVLVLALNGVRPAGAQPVVEGYEVTTYSTLPGPVGLSFDAAGNLFVGQDAPGSGAVSEQFVRRIPAGGGTAADYGPFGLPDPRGVLVDRAPEYATEAGSVIVGGPVNGTSGQVVAILPSDSEPSPTAMVEVLHAAPSGGLVAPSSIEAGTVGLLILDPAAKKLLRLAPPAAPVAIVTSTATPRFLAVDESGEIFVSYDTAIRRYDAAGAVENDSFSVGLEGPVPIAVSPGGDFPAGLYAIESGTGKLYRIADDGARTEIGSGFPEHLGEIEFDHEGALYVASFSAGQILRVGVPAPPPPPADLGPYVCYAAKPGAGGWEKQIQTLEDVFDLAEARVGKPKLACNPATVSGGPIPAPIPNGDEETRIAGHQVKRIPAAPLVPETFSITNALGAHSITTLPSGADRLLVPSAVSVGATAPTALGDESAVDSFQCYEARLAAGSALSPAVVTVVDAVATRDLVVKKPKHFCVPVEIHDRDEIGRPDDRLVCYAVKLAKGETKTGVVSGLRVTNVLATDYRADTVSGSRTTTASATRTGRLAGDVVETFVDEGRTRPGEWDLDDSEGPRWSGGGPLSEDADSLRVTFSDALELGEDVVRRWRIFLEIDIAVNDTNAGPGVVMRANGILGIPDGTEARAMAHGKPAGLRASSAYFTAPSGTTLAELVDGDGETAPELTFEANGDDSAGAFAFQIKGFGIEYEAVTPSQTVRTGTPESELCLPSTIP
jgi:hypothetical protein